MGRAIAGRTSDVEGVMKVSAPQTLHFDGEHETDYRKEESNTASRTIARMTV